MANPFNYFPASYPAAYNPYQQAFQQQPIQPQPQQQQAPQIQNGGLVSVRNRAEAENYPIAPGNSVTFKDETAPFIYVKTMGFSQLDRPTFEMFRLVKEDAPEMPEKRPENALTEKPIDLSDYVKRSEFESVTAKINAIEEKLLKKNKKKEVEDDG